MRASVIIPVFNGAATIAIALRSALDQEFGEPYEVIVVDDGSTDATAQVLATFRARIKTVTQANRGLAAARNAGAAAASADTEYLAFLDADDTWRADKLALSLAALDRNPKAVLAYSDILPVDSEDAPVQESFVTAEFAHAPSMDELLRRWWPILPSSVVMRREVFVRSGGFCERFHRAYEDVDMWLRARELGDFEYVAAPLVRYHTTPIDERMARYEEDYTVFIARLQERYGADCQELLRATRRAYASSLGHRGLIAMHSGDPAAARHYLGRALHYRPLSTRNALRWLRTFMPRRIARALSGRTTARLERSRPEFE